MDSEEVDQHDGSFFYLFIYFSFFFLFFLFVLVLFPSSPDTLIVVSEDPRLDG